MERIFLIICFVFFYSTLHGISRLGEDGVSLEYASWSIDSITGFHQLEEDSMIVNLPWSSALFRSEFKEAVLRVEGNGPYLKFSLSQSCTVFGEPLEHWSQQLYDEGFPVYGSVCFCSDVGLGITVMNWGYGRVICFPFVGVSRFRQGLFFKGYKDIFKSLRSEIKFSEENTREDLPHLFWDFGRIGLMAVMKMEAVVIRGEFFVTPFVKPSILRFDMPGWSENDEVLPHRYGFGYQCSVSIKFRPFIVGFGACYREMKSDVSVPGMSRILENLTVPIEILQVDSGFFLQIGCVF